MLNNLPDRCLLPLKTSFFIILFFVSYLPNAFAQFGNLITEYPITVSKFVVDEPRQRIYASDAVSNNVVVIDATNLNIIANVPVGSTPSGLAISADGLVLYVANSGLPSISLVDLETQMPVGEFMLPAPAYDLAVDADNRVYATPASAGAGIMQIDGFTGTLLTEFSNGVNIYQGGLLKISPDGQVLYFGNRGLSPASLASFDVSVPTPVLMNQAPVGSIGSNGQDLALTHDGQFISYAVGSGNGLYDIFKMQTLDFMSVGSFDTGAYPREIVYSKDDSLAFTVHTAGQIDIFNTADFLQQPPIPTIGEAVELEVGPGGRYLFAAFDGALRVFDILNATLPLPYFPDPAMQQCMNELALQHGWQFAEQVISFTCSGRGVSDLWGLEVLPNLTSLDVSNNQIENIDALGGAPKLVHVNLSGNHVFNFNALGTLNNLRELDISNNQIGNSFPLPFIAGLTQLNLSGNAGINSPDLFQILDRNPGLTHLGLGGIPIADLWSLPLFDPTKGQPYALVELDLSQTQISDINRLNEFPGLQNLNLSGNQITDISVLDLLGNLRQLDLSNNQISNIYPLFTQMGLTQIDLSNNAGINPADLFPILDQNHALTKIGLAGIPVGDLWSLPLSDPFSGQPYALVELNLSNTRISDITRLGEFPGLQNLNLSGNQITDIIALNMMGNMRELDLSNNQVSDVSPLLGMHALTSIDLSNNSGITPTVLNPVLDQNPGLIRIGLAGIPVDLWSLRLIDSTKSQPYALEELNLSNTLTTDLARLGEFPGLQVLKLSGNRIYDINVLGMLRNLHQLDLSNNQISNISTLFSQTGLTQLDLSNNAGINPANLFPILDQNHGLTHIGLGGIPIIDLWSLPLFDPTKGQPYALVELDLSHTQISDINRLNEFRGLQNLNLSGNQITDINVLNSLSNLHQVDLSNNQLSNISPLFTQTGLTQIDLSGNAGINPADLFPILDQNHSLTKIGLARIPVVDLWSLPLKDRYTSQPYALVELNLSHTQISDINRLNEFPGLQNLNLSGNQITDINVLNSLSNLHQVDLSNNQLSNISPLFTQTGLAQIDLSGNAGINPADLFPILDQNHGLTKIGLAGIPVGDLWSLPLFDPTTGQPYSLVELNLRNTQISDITRLAEFPGLRLLNLSGNQITDISSLFMLPELTSLNLFGNDGILCAELDALDALLPSSVLIRPLACYTGNSAPQLTILSPVSSSTFIKGDPIFLQASALDNEDGDIAPMVNWSSNIDGALGSGRDVSALLTAGTHIISATVTDSGGLTSIMSVTVVVEVNMIPQVIMVSPGDGASFVEGDVVTLQATASDNEDGDITTAITWRSSIDGAIGTGGISNVVLSVGTHTITATVIDSHGAPASVSRSVVVDAKPTITITAPVGSPVVTSGTSINLQATASDAEDGDLSAAVQWSSNLDGPLGVGNVNPVLSVGVHILTATVTDSAGSTVSTSASVTINAAPSISIVSPVDGYLVNQPVSIVFAANALDTEDGDISANIQWTSSIDGNLGSGQQIVKWLTPGLHVVTAVIVDSNGASRQSTVSVRVNTLPNVTISFLLNPYDKYTESDEVVFTGSASDFEDGILPVSWKSNIDGELGAYNVLQTKLSPGLHTITGYANDSDGGGGSDSIMLQIYGVPKISIGSPINGTVLQQGQSLSLIASASDFEDGDTTASIQWTSNIDGVLGSGGTASAMLSAGTHLITATVTDSDGFSSSVTANVVVNAAPQLLLTSPADGSQFVEGDVVTLQATASDNEDGDLSTSITWSSSIDGVIGTGGNSNVILSVGTHTITASVTDSHGATQSVVASVVVNANVPPQVSMLSPANGTSFVEGAVVSLQGTATDNEDGDMTSTIAWTSNLDGAIGTGGNSNVILSVGTHTITATVTDSHGAVNSDVVTVVVNANVPPQVTLLSPTNGASFVEGAVVSLQATATDNEDGDMTSTIAWTSNLDGAIGTGGNYNVILSVGTHTIYASVTDSHGVTSTAFATVVVNANVAPQVSMISPTNGASFVEGDVVTLQATASDNEDGDITAGISWSSSIDGVIATGGNSNVILSVGSHIITATITDSHGVISSVSTTVVVNTNVAPQVTLLSPADGASFVEGDIITLQATAVDNEDGDITAKINWSSSIDGAIATGGNSNVILSAGTHTITANVTDRHGATHSVATTVVVKALPIAVAGDDQIVGSSDRVYLDGSASSDSDGNIVSYRWTQISGVSRRLRNADSAVARFRAPRLRRGSTYTLVFELEVTDDQGLTATDQVTIEVR